MGKWFIHKSGRLKGDYIYTEEIIMTSRKFARYERIKEQLIPLFKQVEDPTSRMASAVALLKNKFDYFYWVGFYRFVRNRLLVGPYQGTLACMELEKDRGVIWHGINTGQSVIVPDVNKFPGHIACDSRSKSEVVAPVKDRTGNIVAILDVDSKDFNSFNEDDKKGLEMIAGLIYKNL